jgi:hypothetical protein
MAACHVSIIAARRSCRYGRWCLWRCGIHVFRWAWTFGTAVDRAGARLWELASLSPPVGLAPIARRRVVMDAFLLGASAGDAGKGIPHRIGWEDDLVAHPGCRVERQCRRLGSAPLMIFHPYHFAHFRRECRWPFFFGRDARQCGERVTALL